MVAPDEQDWPECTDALTEPHVWVVHIFEMVLAVLSIIGNCVITVITHQATPTSYGQRRMLAVMSINFSILGGFQLARNVFFVISMYKPCLNMITTISCKLQEFPLLFCYIHAAVIISIISIQTGVKQKDDRRVMTCAASCGIWQSAVIVICIGLTLLFTAFDAENDIQHIPECSILLALRDRELAFILLTLLICLFTFGLITVSISANGKKDMLSHATVLAINLRDVITIETLLWHVSLLCSGILIAYQFIFTDACDECIFVVIEIFFVFCPLLISFIHPLLCLWYIFAIRDAAIRVYPWLHFVLPEYALVPPPPSSCQRIRRIPPSPVVIRLDEIPPTIEISPKKDDTPSNSNSAKS